MKSSPEGVMAAKTEYYRKMFFIGALWNLAAAAVFLFFQKPLFAMFAMPPLDYPIFYQMVCVLVFAFGIGYYWVSLNLRDNRGLVKLAAALKIATFVFFVYYCAVGSLHWSFVGTGLVDLVFGILFIEFLICSSCISDSRSGEHSRQ